MLFEEFRSPPRASSSIARRHYVPVLRNFAEPLFQFLEWDIDVSLDRTFLPDLRRISDVDEIEIPAARQCGSEFLRCQFVRHDSILHNNYVQYSRLPDRVKP